MPVPNPRQAGPPPERWRVNTSRLRLAMICFLAGASYASGRRWTAADLHRITGVPQSELSDLRTREQAPAKENVLAMLAVMKIGADEVMAPASGVAPAGDCPQVPEVLAS